jgi:chromosome partitioning protein
VSAITIAITNQKGGVGKTTTTVNLASALAGMKYRTLIVDMDPQGHAGEHLGVRKPKTVLEVLTKQATIEDNISLTYKINLFCLPSNLQLGQFNQLDPRQYQFALKEVLASVKDNFDFILIDCQPSLSLLTLNSLVSADYVILPVQAEFFALDGLSQLVFTLKEIQNRLHPNLNVLGILLTMFDRRNRLSLDVRNELTKNFGDTLFHTIIPRNIKLAEAPSFNQSILEYDPISSGSDSYKQLAREIIRKLEIPQPSKS